MAEERSLSGETGAVKFLSDTFELGDAVLRAVYLGLSGVIAEQRASSWRCSTVQRPPRARADWRLPSQIVRDAWSLPP